MADTRRRSRIKICLAASGGGHVRQLLDLEPFWKDFDRFFVTEDTALGRDISDKHNAYFVAHVALGQARLGSPVRMVVNAIKNCFAAAKIILKERPDVVITTGAGSMYFLLLWARLTGARIVLIDSFARFTGPSAFARLAGPLAHVRISQAADAAREWGNALCFDPFRGIDRPRPEKERLLFATVGATLPFDRLIEMVEAARQQGLIPERIVAQTGAGGVRPPALAPVETLPFDEIKSLLHKADIVVCHGGTGSLIMALREGCRVIAVPRRFDLGEHYDDHQLEISRALAARGLITLAEGPADLPAALEQARSQEPRCATTDPSELIDYLREYTIDEQQRLLKPEIAHDPT